MDVQLGVGDLLTVAGAGAAAFVVAQFAKMLFTLGPAAVRSVSLVTGLLVVVLVTVFSGAELTVPGVLLSVLVGMQAGMSAYAMFDTARAGLDYRVYDPPTPPAGDHIAPIT